MSERKIVTVREIMSSMPEPIDGLASVRDAIERMKQSNIRSLVIDRRHESDEYGMVVVSDIANEVIAKNRSLDRTNVYEIMSKPTLTVDASMDIKYAIRLLGRFGLERALVIDHNELAGLVTLRDMVFRYVDIDRTAGADEDGD
jgi:signal-transduction protein with cAMP-binding, CBS, and nucleotidyltransferase domain